MNVLDDAIRAHTFSAGARARLCVVERGSELFCASPSACGLHRPDALGEPTAPGARAECSSRAGGDSRIFRKRHGPPTDPIQPHAQAFHAFFPVLSRRMPRHLLPASMDVVKPYSSLARCVCFYVQFAVALSMSLIVRRCLCVPLCVLVCLSAPHCVSPQCRVC